MIEHDEHGPFIRLRTDGLLRVHTLESCDHPTACAVHGPSNHHMRAWNITWRGDKGVEERICSHGVGHPDPDSAVWRARNGLGYLNVHGCDGCCGAGPRENDDSPDW